MTPDLLLRRCRLVGVGARSGAPLVDVLLRDGLVASVVPSGVVPSGAGAAAGTEEPRVLDLDGRWLLPGLWDEHVHLDQWALVRRRLDVAAAASARATADLVRERLAAEGPADPRSATPLVGYGFRDGLWPDLPSPELLDDAAAAAGQAGRPVVLVSADLHCAWLSSSAARQLAAPLGLAPDALGLLREDAAFALSRSLGAAGAAGGAGASAVDAVDDAVAEALADAAGRGVVGVVDLEMTDAVGGAPAVWRRRVSRGGAPLLRVEAGVYPDQLDAHLDAAASGPASSTTTYAKVITDGSLNTRTACCSDAYPGGGPHGGGHGDLAVPPEVLLPLLRRAVAAGLVPAVHAIGDAAVGHALDVLAALRADGWRGPARVEHAQLVAARDVGRFAALDVTASVQPAHLLDDRDVAETHWAGRTHRAFPLRALLDAGARLALGSDAPVAPLDPWLAMAAAVHRGGGASRPAWHPEQAVSAAQALTASTRGRAVVEAGSAADVVAVEHDVLDVLHADPAAAPSGGRVSLTVMGGRVVHSALG